MITGTASTSTKPRYPPIQKITAMNSTTNGRSTRAVIVAEVMNSRNDSNSWMLLAKEPTEAGRASIRMPIAFSKIVAERMTSIRLPATSTR